jgi:ATP-dependent protease ClpP protease subunit
MMELLMPKRLGAIYERGSRVSSDNTVSTEQYLEVLDEYNNRGQIFVGGSFNDMLANYSGKQFLDANEAAVKLGRDYTTIVIDSQGGSVTVLHRLVYCMHTFRPNADFKYVGYAAVQAGSAAFDLLQYCDWRISHPGTHFTIHYGTSSMSNYDQALLYENSRMALKYHKSRIDGVLDLYEKRSKLRRSQIHNLCKADTRLTASEALEYGFIDEIIHVAPNQVPSRPNYSLTF